MTNLKIETNVGKVELINKAGELCLEHQFTVSNKDYTFRINFTKKETRDIIKLLKEVI